MVVMDHVEPVATLEFLSQGQNSLEFVKCGTIWLLTSWV